MAIFDSEEITPSSDVKERIMEALVEGKDMTIQLWCDLRRPDREGSEVLSRELTSKILGSFNKSLSELSAQYPLPKHVPSAGNKEGSAETRVRRGCYKRRKSSQTRTTVAFTIKDNHAWRKYGQKDIHNSKFPRSYFCFDCRSYFRCSHKYDQSCKAVKQVQMMQQNPSLYEITYIDVHTCTDDRKAPPPPPPQMTLDSSPLWDGQSYHALSITNPPDINREDMILFSSSSSVTALAMKEEAKDMEINSLLMGSKDLEEGNSMYQGSGMEFFLEEDGSNISLFDS